MYEGARSLILIEWNDLRFKSDVFVPVLVEATKQLYTLQHCVMMTVLFNPKMIGHKMYLRGKILISLQT